MSTSTMLIVDDSRLVRTMIRKFAASAAPDLDFLEAEHAEAALKCVEGRPVNLMTIDYNMQGANGIELASELKGRFPDAHISIVSANVQDVIRSRADAIGVGFIAKPVTEQKILDFVRRSA